MVEKLLQLLFISCSHRKTSQPFAAAMRVAGGGSSESWETVGPALSHYVVCLDCGKKFTYDWSNMRIVRN
jgi:hypothetical protein